MHIRRFFVEEIRTDSGPHLLTGPEARHIARVLRMGPGDRLILIDNKGRRVQAVIDSVSPGEVRVTVGEDLPRPKPSPLEITLCQAVLKSASMDYVVQKSSELGVNKILPFTSQRTVVRMDKKRMENRIRHWVEISRNATKQSGRGVPAELSPVSSISELLAGLGGYEGIKLILWEGKDAQDLRTLLKSSPPQKSAAGLVGPEGGFSAEEVDYCARAGFIPVSLGPRILRAETAAIVIVAILQYEWGDLGLG